MSLTSRMLFNAAQREADKGKDGSDLTFARLLWMAQILAAIETAEALGSRSMSDGDDLIEVEIDTEAYGYFEGRRT